MEDLLIQLKGKKIDASCGTTAVYRGDVEDVKNGVLYLRDDDDKLSYLAIEKIAAVYECADALSRPGFVV